MSDLLRLQLALSSKVDRTDDRGFRPMCDVLASLAAAPETPPELRRAIRQAIDEAKGLNRVDRDELDALRGAEEPAPCA